MSEWRIPFNRPSLVGNETLYLRQAVEDGHISGDGAFTRRCSELLESLLGVGRVLLTPSGTHALEMCALLLEVGPGDEFVVPSFAFVTTASAFALRGGRPVFLDVRPDTLNLDETQLRGKITPRTKAIVALHYAGVACEMDAIQEVSRETGVPIVEDNALGLFGSYRGRLLGSFGCLAIQSFHETKNISCGEGGALLINRPDLVERAEILREKGTDRSRFFRGQVDKYTWVDLGSSYLPSELQAAFLYAQLEARERIPLEAFDERRLPRFAGGARTGMREHNAKCGEPENKGVLHARCPLRRPLNRDAGGIAGKLSVHLLSARCNGFFA